MSTQNELQTAAGYFALFKFEDSLAATPASRTTDELRHRASSADGEEDASGGDREEEGCGGDRQSFWRDDEYSEEFAAEAEETLRRALPSCDVVSVSSPSSLVGGPAAGEELVRKLEADAARNWDRFYSRNLTKFFKDRHYLQKTFPEEFGPIFADDEGGAALRRAYGDEEAVTVVEIGCGVGNTVLPLLERSEALKRRRGARPCLRVWGFDFSSVAVGLLRKDPRFIDASLDGRARAGVWDITAVRPHALGAEGVANVSLLLFCLSAVGPEKMGEAAVNAAATLKPGGTLVFRDYGRYDEAQLKLGTSERKRLGENFYVKHDGTRCYYFDLEDLRRLFGKEEGGAGLDVMELKYIRRIYNNRRTNVMRRRVWVQGRFRKPPKMDSED